MGGQARRSGLRVSFGFDALTNFFQVFDEVFAVQKIVWVGSLNLSQGVDGYENDFDVIVRSVLYFAELVECFGRAPGGKASGDTGGGQKMSLLGLLELANPRVGRRRSSVGLIGRIDLCSCGRGWFFGLFQLRGCGWWFGCGLRL